MTLMDGAGSPSPVGSLLPNPYKPKFGQKPNISEYCLFSESFPLSTTRNHSDSYLEPPCVIFWVYVLWLSIKYSQL